MKDTGEGKKKETQQQKKLCEAPFLYSRDVQWMNIFTDTESNSAPMWLSRKTHPIAVANLCLPWRERWQKLCMAKNVYVAPEMTSGIGRQIHKT